MNICHLFIFPFYWFVCFLITEFCETLYVLMQILYQICYMFSFRSFIFLCFTFRSMILFELIFAYDVSYTSKSTYLNTDIQFFLSHLWNRLSFLHWITFTPICIKPVDHICMGLFLDSVLFHNTQSWLLWLYNDPWGQIGSTSNFVLFQLFDLF